MAKQRITYRVLREVRDNGVGGNVPALQLVQKYEGAKSSGVPEYRFISYFNGVLRPNRGQGITARLDVVKFLFQKMEVLEKALDAIKPGRSIIPEAREEIVEELLDLDEDDNVTDEDF